MTTYYSAPLSEYEAKNQISSPEYDPNTIDHISEEDRRNRLAKVSLPLKSAHSLAQAPSC